jgi:hypothetical protein
MKCSRRVSGKNSPRVSRMEIHADFRGRNPVYSKAIISLDFYFQLNLIDKVRQLLNVKDLRISAKQICVNQREINPAEYRFATKVFVQPIVLIRLINGKLLIG